MALEVAKAGATLRRNERGTLPLTGGSIAVIGRPGSLPFVSGGGSAHVVPDHADRPLDALRARGGEVTYALGEDIFGKAVPAAALSPGFDSEGLRIEAGRTWSYDGTLTVDEADEWTFVIHHSGAPTIRPKVVLDGEELFPLVPGWGEYSMGGYVTTAATGCPCAASR